MTTLELNNPIINKSRANNIIRYLDELSEKLGILNIVETGTIRNVNPEYILGDGHSTHVIARWILESGMNHNFVSVDLNVKIAREYLNKLGLLDYVQFIESDSITYLENRTDPIDFIYLDSGNDAELILQEFQAVESLLTNVSYVMVDDCLPGNKEIKKCNEVIPYVKNMGYNVKLLARQGVIWL